ncbi:MAG: hypothetical protein CMH81_07235 [Nitrospiraceae bacterium]|nr:hypothetical protein [Nitrospiraceae bacterium]|tara:strand:+ start:7819 stop:8307 length:489 start_codon:yes stop_codon:yes gene_type:complete
MRREIIYVCFSAMIFSFATAHAAEVFKLDITKIVEACDNGDFETTPTSEMWFSFDASNQLTIAFNADFENPIVMKMVRYIKSSSRAEFVAIIASEAIHPAVQAPPFEVWFYSIYGRIMLDEDLQAVFLKGDVHASYISSEGNQNPGNKCLLRMKFRSVERLE